MSLNLLLCRRKHIMQSQTNFVLPYDAEIEYLQTTGTQYIDTGINGQSVTRFIIQGYCYVNGTNNTQLLGGIESSTSTFFGARIINNTKNWYCTSNGSSLGNPENNSIIDATINSVSSQTGTLTDLVNNTSYSFDNFNYANFSFPNSNLLLFGGYSTRRSPNARCYSLKIYTSSGLVRDFIPVRIGQVGYMYDRVSGKLFGNSGTGDFMLGYDKGVYIQENLVFNLDCTVGRTTDNNKNYWTDTAGNVSFEMSNVDWDDSSDVEWSDSVMPVKFNGSTSKGLSDVSSIDVDWNNATIEICGNFTLGTYSNTALFAPFLANRGSGKAAFVVRKVAYTIGCCSTNASGVTSVGKNGSFTEYNLAFYLDSTEFSLSTSKGSTVNGGIVYLNGTKVNQPQIRNNADVNDYTAGNSNYVSIGYRNMTSNGAEQEKFLNGTIYAIRIYSTTLTKEQRLHNYNIDKEKFELS